jgi:hypothetical protein
MCKYHHQRVSLYIMLLSVSKRNTLHIQMSQQVKKLKHHMVYKIENRKLISTIREQTTTPHTLQITISATHTKTHVHVYIFILTVIVILM